MKLLMHICCSNCAIFPLEHYLVEGIDIKGFWFNPNIHPYTEYSKRLESVERLSRLWNFDVEYRDDYVLDSFLASIVGKGADRCSVCYETRLDKTAEAARSMGMNGFTTSLLASPYQKFDKIIQIGKDAGKRHGIMFHYEDLRTGWNASRSLSVELELYRQKYCGCIYSEMERFRKKRLHG